MGSFLVSQVLYKLTPTPVHIYNSQKLGSLYERDHMEFLFLSLKYFSQYIIYSSHFPMDFIPLHLSENSIVFTHHIFIIHHQLMGI